MKHYCREASRLLSDGYERDLSAGERIRLRLHLWMCGACTNYRLNLEAMNRLLQTMRRHADAHAPCLTAAQRQSILQALRQEEDSV